MVSKLLPNLAGLLFLGGLACQSPPLPEYQQNSAEIALTLNGQVGDAFSPASDVVWLGGEAGITLEVVGPSPLVTILAYESDLLISRSEGAAVTGGGQLINLPGGATFSVTDVTGSVSSGVLNLPIPTDMPCVLALQAMVFDAGHPDGFRVSAPVILRVAVPTHTFLRGEVDLDALSSNTVSVEQALGLAFSDPDVALGEHPTYSVAGTAALIAPSIGEWTVPIVVDGSAKQVLVSGTPIASLYDVFPVSIAETGQLELSFESPVSIAIDNMFLAPLAMTTWKTDKGTVIQTGPYGFPQVTSERALEIINNLSPGLGGAITEVSPPNNKFWCHSFTFLPPGTQTGIFGEDVDTILSENGYYRSDIPSPVPGHVAVGDVVVYRGPGGEVLHTGVVQEVDESGQATKIRSKWSYLGVYDHAPDDVPPDYKPPGGAIEYWRSNRSGGNALKDP